MLRIFALLSFGALAFGAAHAQVWEEWMRLHRGSGANGAFDAALDPRENILVLGDDPHSGTDRAMVIKYSPVGDVVWTQTYRAPNQRYTAPREIRAHRDGTFVISTHTEGYDDNIFFELVKYDNDGNRLWVYRYDKPGTLDEYQRMDMDAHGNVCVAGVWHVFDVQRGQQGFVIKVSPEGQLVWETALEYDSPWSIPANRIAVSPDGGTIGVAGTLFLGYTHDRYALGNDALVWRLDTLGQIVATTRIAPYHDPPRSINIQAGIRVADDRILLGGLYSTTSAPANAQVGNAPWSAAIDVNGNLVWRNDFDFGSDRGTGAFRSLMALPEGRTVFSGWTIDSVLLTVIIESDGAVSWLRTLRDPAFHLGGYRLGFDQFGDLYLGLGIAVRATISHADFGALVYSRNGEMKWRYHYNGLADNYDNLYQMCLDSRGGVYLVGSTVWDWSSLSDWITIKLCQRWGDADNDGRVDATDLEIVLERFGSFVPNGEQGDVTEDGIVDDADLSLVLWMFGETCP